MIVGRRVAISRFIVLGVGIGLLVLGLLSGNGEPSCHGQAMARGATCTQDDGRVETYQQQADRTERNKVGTLAAGGLLVLGAGIAGLVAASRPAPSRTEGHGDPRGP